MTAFKPGQSPPPVMIPTRMGPPYRRSGVGLRRGRLGQQPGIAGFPCEVVRLGEPLVHTGETEVGDLVEGTQPFEHGEPDLFGADLGPGEPHLLLHLERDIVELRVGEGPVFRGGPQAGDDLGAVPRLAVARPLDHQQGHVLDPLIGGEAPAAAQALPPPPDRRSVLSEPRVDDLVVERRAHRAAHPPTLPSGPPGDAGPPGAQGSTICWPTWRGRPCTSRLNASTSGRTSPLGSRRRAIAQRVSPGWTTHT